MGRQNLIASAIFLMFIGFLVFVFNDTSHTSGAESYESIYQAFFACMIMLSGLIGLLLTLMWPKSDVDIIQQKLNEITLTSEE